MVHKSSWVFLIFFNRKYDDVFNTLSKALRPVLTASLSLSQNWDFVV